MENRALIQNNNIDFVDLLENNFQAINFLIENHLLPMPRILVVALCFLESNRMSSIDLYGVVDLKCAKTQDPSNVDFGGRISE